MTIRTKFLQLALLVVLVLAVAPACASAALTVSDVRIGAQPAFVRVVIDMTGGAARFNEIDATDHAVRDGDGRVEISHRGIVARSIDRSAQGVRVRVSRPAANRARVGLTLAIRRFKYVRVFALHGPERFVIDLYRSGPPTAGAEIRSAANRCLTLTSVARSGHRFRVRGTELNLFEASFELRIRDASGRIVGRRIATARGAWDLSLSYSAVSRAQAGTVEAFASSAKDGSLVCLVQRRVSLVP